MGFHDYQKNNLAQFYNCLGMEMFYFMLLRLIQSLSQIQTIKQLFYHKTDCRQVGVGKVIEKDALEKEFNFECVVPIGRCHPIVVDVKLSQKFCSFV
jgi:hypothetical protein